MQGRPINLETEYENLKQALLDSLSKRSKPLTDSSGEDSQDAIEIKYETSISSTKTEPRTDWAIKPASPSSEDLEETFINEDSIDSPEPGPSYLRPIRTKRKLDNTKDHEEISYFANFIASKMKNYSETTKNAVQKEICEVIFKADQHYYETIATDGNYIVYDPLDAENQSKKTKR